MSEEEVLQHRSEIVRLLREDPHTDWILDLFNWTSLPLLLIGLTPCLFKVWRTDRIRSGIMPIWFVLILWYIWECVIAPYLAMRWTRDRRIWSYFPEGPAVVAITFVGWLPACFLSSLTWIMRWIYFWIIRRKRGAE